MYSKPTPRPRFFLDSTYYPTFHRKHRNTWAEHDCYELELALLLGAESASYKIIILAFSFLERWPWIDETITFFFDALDSLARQNTNT